MITCVVVPCYVSAVTPETKNRTLEEIELSLAKDSPARGGLTTR